MLQSSNKQYFNPSGFDLAFGREGTNIWRVQRTDPNSFRLVFETQDETTKEKGGGSFTFVYTEFINLGQSLALSNLPHLFFAQSKIYFSEVSGNRVELIFKTTEEGPRKGIAIPTLVDPAREGKPAIEIPFPEPIAQALELLTESLNPRQ